MVTNITGEGADLWLFQSLCIRSFQDVDKAFAWRDRINADAEAWMFHLHALPRRAHAETLIECEGCGAARRIERLDDDGYCQTCRPAAQEHCRQCCYLQAPCSEHDGHATDRERFK